MFHVGYKQIFHLTWDWWSWPYNQIKAGAAQLFTYITLPSYITAPALVGAQWSMQPDRLIPGMSSNNQPVVQQDVPGKSFSTFYLAYFRETWSGTTNVFISMIPRQIRHLFVALEAFLLLHMFTPHLFLHQHKQVKPLQVEWNRFEVTAVLLHLYLFRSGQMWSPTWPTKII